MAANPDSSAEKRITLWQVVLLVLSLFVLASLLAETVLSLPEAVATLLRWADTAICVVFLADFFYNVATARDRLEYLKWGWIDLVSSIPNLDLLRWGRLVRVVRILRILRAIRSVRIVFKMLFARRATSVFVTTVVASFLIVIFSAIGILNLEDGPHANIRTAEDALWWSFEMLGSQSSSRLYPVTTGGRILAVGLMFAGAGVFGAFIAIMSALVMGEEEEKIETGEAEILAELRELRTRVDALGAQVESLAQGEKKT
ncbi:MAG: ion transporter [Proteobacteria bacterium]|nr:ion transporter [Pseudomonadota bacterium]